MKQMLLVTLIKARTEKVFFHNALFSQSRAGGEWQTASSTANNTDQITLFVNLLNNTAFFTLTCKFQS